MANNFDFLQQDARFAAFASVAASAENLVHVDAAACVLCCRRAMELAVKWMYETDDTLQMPARDTLVTLLGGKAFRRLLGEECWHSVDLLRRMGNAAAHDAAETDTAEAAACVEQLYGFLQFVAGRYGKDPVPRPFDAALLDLTREEALSFVSERPAPASAASVRPDERTRQAAVRFLLRQAGWGAPALREQLRLANGRTAQFALTTPDGTVTALLAADADRERAGQQAVKWAKGLRPRPVVFFGDGVSLRVQDNRSPERDCAGLWSPDDVQRRSAMKQQAPVLPPDAALRPYQKDAVQAVCAALQQGRRRLLLTMSTGTGKTRVAAAVTACLLRADRAQRILYLSDRPSLTAQARHVFAEVLPGVVSADLEIPGADAAAPLIFATYRTMLEEPDSFAAAGQRLFTCGRFDLLFCDELRPDIREQFGWIPDCFDAPALALTDAPEEKIEEETAEMFGGEPVFAYTEAEAVAGGWTVPGCRAALPAVQALLPSDASEETLRTLLRQPQLLTVAAAELAAQGIGGAQSGKTIVFAADGEHARQIRDIFASQKAWGAQGVAVIPTEDPAPEGAEAQTAAAALLEKFAKPDTPLRVAVSAGALENGVDLPAVTALVLLTPVSDAAQLRQMLGRGARPCPAIGKTCYRIYDPVGNAERLEKQAAAEARAQQVQIALLEARLRLIGLLPETAPLRRELLEQIPAAVAALDLSRFAVARQRVWVERCRTPQGCATLRGEQLSAAVRALAPLLPPSEPVAAEEELRRLQTLLPTE